MGTLLLAASGCGGHKIDLGGNDAGGSDDGGTDLDSGTGTEASGGGDGGPPPTTIDGHWTGYIDGYQFHSGSNAVAMTIQVDQSGGVLGTMVLGNAPAPPPPTDPDAGYPPGFDGTNAEDFREGFGFTVHGSFEAARLLINVGTLELWKAWCQLQSPTYGWGPDGGAPYNCLPSETTTAGQGTCYLDPPNQPMIPVDCGKFVLCGYGVTGCLCSATSCTLDLSHPDFNFDAQYTPNHLDGTVATDDLMVHNVHFTR